MIRQIIVKNQKFTLDKRDVIGEGGEAVIFRLQNKAIKIYRQPIPQRVKKLKDFFRQNFILPDNVLYPLELAYTGSGQVIGFLMNRLKAGCDPIAVLANKRFCAQNGITTKRVVNLFCGIYQALLDIHQAGIVVGDLNDRNEVLDPAYNKIAWLDVDSWQWGSYPCMVGTEAYLSPDLYGIDLSQAAHFKQEHDWYSFAVLLFRSLLRIHPFRAGIHPRYKSLMLRAKKGITVLDADVRYPMIGLPPDILSDELTDILIKYLKRQIKEPFPFDQLGKFLDILVECPSCGLWYAGLRKSCPGCQVKNIIDMRLKQILAGCECETLITTSGKVIFFQIVDTTIYCLVDESGVTYLYKKLKGHNVVKKEMFKTRPGAKFGLFDQNLVICISPTDEEPELFVLDISGQKPRAVLKTLTRSMAGGKAVFVCSAKYLYRIVGSRIMRGEIFNRSNQLLEREVIQSLEGQTWFTVSPNPTENELLVGFYRVFGDLKWFLVKSENKTSCSRFEIELPELTPRESLIDLSIKFSDNSVLIIRKTRRAGIDYVHLDVIDGHDSQITHSQITKVSELEQYENIHGKAFKKGIVIHPTSQGVLYEKITQQQSDILTDSEQFISAGDSLYVYGNNILAVTDDRVLLIKPKKVR